MTYENLDFGDYGSNELTIPVFALDGQRYTFDLWLGKPGAEGSRMLTQLVYEKPSIWNVYQEETFRLPERIRGLATITLVAREKVHIKGFIGADEISAIYGDSFTREPGVIRRIGNNVTIAIENMDFGNLGTTKVTLCGRTPHEVNAVHILFTNEAGVTVRRMVEFQGTGSEQCTEQTFRIDRIVGKGKIELVFLPGSEFDLKSVQFGR